MKLDDKTNCLSNSYSEYKPLGFFCFSSRFSLPNYLGLGAIVKLNVTAPEPWKILAIPNYHQIKSTHPNQTNPPTCISKLCAPSSRRSEFSFCRISQIKVFQFTSGVQWMSHSRRQLAPPDISGSAPLLQLDQLIIGKLVS